MKNQQNCVVASNPRLINNSCTLPYTKLGWKIPSKRAHLPMAPVRKVPLTIIPHSLPNTQGSVNVPQIKVTLSPGFQVKISVSDSRFSLNLTENLR